MCLRKLENSNPEHVATYNRLEKNVPEASLIFLQTITVVIWEIPSGKSQQTIKSIKTAAIKSRNRSNIDLAVGGRGGTTRLLKSRKEKSLASLEFED